MLKYFIQEMNQQDVEYYTNEIKETDAVLAREVNARKYPNLTEQEISEITQFLYARIGSLGQLTYKRVQENNNKCLRNYIIETDFKHEDNTESKNFLYLVAQIEKEYIQERYGKEIDFYKKKSQEVQDRNGQESLKERVHVPFTPVASQTENRTVDVKEKQESRIENPKEGR